MTTISASKTLGIDLNPASYTNPVVIDPGVTISDSSFSVAVSVSGSPFVFTIQNDGAITGSGVGLVLTPGGTVTNAAAASITGDDAGIAIGGAYGAVVNDGQITGGVLGGQFGLTLAAGGAVTNAGSITGGTGIAIAGVAGTVVNDGGISGQDASGDGVYLYFGGAVTNASTATITGGYQAIEVTGRTGLVVNAGSIASTGRYGVDLRAGGSVINFSSGSITGDAIGVELSSDSTLRNAGTIVGNGGTAVYFSGTGGNLLVIDPGAIFSGAIDTAGTAGNALELASASSAGTLAGAGKFFANLGSTTIDSGASWQLSGAKLLDFGGLANDGKIALGPSTLLAASVTGTGTIAIDADSTLIVQGTVAAGQTIEFVGIGGVLDLGDPADMAGTIVGFVAGDVTHTGPGTVGNTGTLAGSGSYGVIIGTGGLVTNAATGSISGSYTGAFISGGLGTVVNDGHITGTARYGIDLRSGGSVTNAAAATIVGGADGVLISGGTGAVVNDGTIATQGTQGSGSLAPTGVALRSGGTVTNAASATILGHQTGIYISGGAGVVVNDGSIAQTGSAGEGILLLADGSVTNAASASITGGAFGVDLYAGGTLTNAGTITASGTAVAFYGTGSNRLVLDPGYRFFGLVSGSASAGNTMELASAASAGTLTNFGTGFANFGATVFDLGSKWFITGAAPVLAGTATILGTVQEQATSFANTGSIIVDAGTLDASTGTFDNSAEIITVENGGSFLVAGAAVLDGGSVTMDSGSVTNIAGASSSELRFGDPATLILGDPAAFTGTIGGFAPGDEIDLTGQTIISGAITGTTLTLNLAGGGTQTLSVAPGEAGVMFKTAASGGLEVVACFASGTCILTATGATEVEALAEGDLLVTLAGRLRPIRWIGNRHVVPDRCPRPQDVWPVRVQAGTFGAGMPDRDLWLSPDHAVFIEGALIPVRHLVNDATIVQEQMESVTYWHVELDEHEVILAEGLPCESYLDTGNRAAFADSDRATCLVGSAA